MTTGTRALRFIDALTVDLAASALDPAQIVEGEPSAASAAFAAVGQTEVGVWEHSPGTSTDVEVDEVFLVLAGRATVAFDTGETVELRPGRLVRLSAGERTTWTVHETIRKLYATVS